MSKEYHKPTPKEYLAKMRNDQGERPVSWARCLASLVNLGVMTKEEAVPYAEVLAGASSDEQDFLTRYNKIIQAWEEKMALSSDQSSVKI